MRWAWWPSRPAVAGGWTAQLPRIVTGRELDRGSALDGLTFSAASLAGPALAAGVAAGIGTRAAVLTAAGLVALAVPSACSLSRYRPAAAGGTDPGGTDPGAAGGTDLGGDRVNLRRQMAAGFAVIVARRPLLRATVTSVVSYAGIGMLLVCCPLLGAQRLGGAARGALLISATAVAALTANASLARRPGPPRRRRPGRPRPDTRVLVSTLVIGASMAAAALAPGWLTLAAVALSGAGEGPQLTAPLAGWSVTGCLLIAAGTELCAAAAYLTAGFTGPGGREPASAPPPGPAVRDANADRPVRSE